MKIITFTFYILLQVYFRDVYLPHKRSKGSKKGKQKLESHPVLTELERHDLPQPLPDIDSDARVREIACILNGQLPEIEYTLPELSLEALSKDPYYFDKFVLNILKRHEDKFEMMDYETYLSLKKGLLGARNSEYNKYPNLCKVQITFETINKIRNSLMRLVQHESLQHKSTENEILSEDESIRLIKSDLFLWTITTYLSSTIQPRSKIWSVFMDLKNKKLSIFRDFRYNLRIPFALEYYPKFQDLNLFSIQKQTATLTKMHVIMHRIYNDLTQLLIFEMNVDTHIPCIMSMLVVEERILLPIKGKIILDLKNYLLSRNLSKPSECLGTASMKQMKEILSDESYQNLQLYLESEKCLPDI